MASPRNAIACALGFAASTAGCVCCAHAAMTLSTSADVQGRNVVRMGRDNTKQIVINLERQLRRALTPPLPGLEAQLRMAPQPRVGWDPEHPPPNLRDAAALVLVYPFNEVPH